MESRTKAPLTWLPHSALIQHTWGSWTSVTTTCNRNLSQSWTVSVRTTRCANCKNYGWLNSVRDFSLLLCEVCSFFKGECVLVLEKFFKMTVSHSIPNGCYFLLATQILWVCLDAEMVKGEFDNMFINYSLLFSVEPSARCYLKSTLKKRKWPLQTQHRFNQVTYAIFYFILFFF